MAESISNMSQISLVGSGTLTAAAVGPGDAAVIDLGGRTGFKGSATIFEANSSAPTDTYLYTAWVNLSPTTYDISGADQYIIGHFRNEIGDYHQFPTTGTDGDEAVAFILFSGGGSTNWAVWWMPYSSTLVDGLWHPKILGVTTPDATGGTFDNTDVTGFGFGSRVSGTSQYVMNSMFHQMVYIDGIPEFGDTNGDVTTFQGYIDILSDHTSTAFSHKAIEQAGTTFELGHSFELTARNFNDSTDAVGVAFRSDSLGYAGIADGTFKANFTPPASGTQVLDNYSFASLGSKPDMTIDASAASSAITLTSCLLATMEDISITGAGATLATTTIVSPTNITIADGDYGVTITGISNDIQWTSDLVAGSSITTDSDIDITFAETDLSDITVNLTASNTVTVSPTTGSGTYDLSGLTTTGTANFDNATANDTTVTLPAGTTNTVESPTAGGGAIEVDNAVTVTVSVTALDESLTAVSGAAVYLEAATGGPLPFQESATITRSGSTATVTHTAHGRATNDEVKVRGADQDEYNIAATVTVTGANTYTYTVTGTPTTPATGTITSTYVILNSTTNGSGVLEDTAFTYTSDQPISGTVRKSTSSPYYKPGVIAGTIASAGLSSTVILVSDE